MEEEGGRPRKERWEMEEEMREAEEREVGDGGGDEGGRKADTSTLLQYILYSALQRQRTEDRGSR